MVRAGEERRARLLRRILISLIVVCLANAALVWLPGASPEPAFGTAYVLALAVVLGLALRMTQRGMVRAAATLTLVLLLVGVAVAVFLFGGVRGPDVLGFIPLVLLAGLLRGRSFAIGCVIASVLAVIGLAVLEGIGVGPVVAAPLGLVETTVIVAMIAAISGVFLVFAVTEIEDSLAAAEEAALVAQKSEARIADMVEQLPDGFVAMTTDGVVTECNPRMIDLLGVSRDALIGSALVELEALNPGSRGRWLRLLAEIRAGRAAGLIEIELRSEHGPPRALELHTRITTTIGGERAVHVIARDVTARVQAAAEKADLEAQLLEAHRLESLGRLAGGVAHDFNNLLTAIVANSDLLSRTVGDGDKKLVEEIHQAGERASDLTQQLLAFARKQVREPRVMSINQALRDVSNILRRLVPEDIQIEIDTDEELAPVRADPAQLEQVNLNLVTNARDAMDGGGRLTILTRGELLSEGSVPELPAGSYAVLSVADTGPGLDPETRAHLFEPFFTTKGSQGSGLGLATVHGIVKQNGGCIRVVSAPGAGARFEVLLPAVDEPETVAPSKPAYSPAVFAARVLVVDDDTLVRETVARLLRAAGYVVESVETAAEALELAPKWQPDLLITDVVLPKMRGPELARELRRERPELRVLFISGYAEEVMAQDGAVDPDVEFLAKPFSFESFTSRVAEVLARS